MTEPSPRGEGDRMKAIVVARPGGPEVLELRDVDAPLAGKGEVRVRVHATAVNRADLLQRRGLYPAPPDSPRDIPGLEFAGEVESLGDGAHDVRVGDKVFGLAGGGTYAELVVVPSRTVVPMPPGLSFADAAAVPEAFITAFDALVTQGRLAAGEDVLISAAGSGVGTAGVQLARAVGARPIGTVRTAAKAARLRSELGLPDALVVEGPAYKDAIRERTAGRGVALVLELVGGSYVAEDLECVAHKGRIVLVGLVGGARVDMDLGLVLRKRISLTGTVLRARSLEEKIVASQLFAAHVVPLLARGLVRPVVGATMPLCDAAEAHRLTEANDTFGKVVLTLAQ